MFFKPDDLEAFVSAIISYQENPELWRDQLGSSVEEAADDVDWVVRAAIASAASRNR